MTFSPTSAIFFPSNTVDGRTSAPVDMELIRSFTRFDTSERWLDGFQPSPVSQQKKAASSHDRPIKK